MRWADRPELAEASSIPSMVRGRPAVAIAGVLLFQCGQSGGGAPTNGPTMECGGQPCCGNPPRPCGEVLAPNAGTIVIEQLMPSCEVLLDGRPWPGIVAVGQ